MGRFRSNSRDTNWPKNHLFIKQIIQVNTNLTQTHLFSTQIYEKRVEFVLGWGIVSHFATPRLPHMILW